MRKNVQVQKGMKSNEINNLTQNDIDMTIWSMRENVKRFWFSEDVAFTLASVYRRDSESL